MSSESPSDTLIKLKIFYDGQIYRHTLRFRELIPGTLPDKLHEILNIPSTSEIRIERYSDTLGTHILLDSKHTVGYKQLYRAAWAKLRLRLRVTKMNQYKSIPNITLSEKGIQSLSNIQSPSPSFEQVPSICNPSLPTTAISCDEPGIPDSQSYRKEHPERLANKETHNAQLETDKANTAMNGILPTEESSSISPSNIIHKQKCEINNEISDQAALSSSNVSFRTESCLHAQSTYSHVLSTDNKKKESSGTSLCPFDLTIFCNHCDSMITGGHYHCSNCDDGDYDLCQKCVDNGILCNGDGHWLIKRIIKNGKAVNSTTEISAPKSRIKSRTGKDLGRNHVAFASRTCNCCIQVFAEDEFVTCTTCLDFDLCISCHLALKHGHHPNHAFEAVAKNKRLNPTAQTLLAPGRHVQHDAICDGCEKTIHGVRHKCFDCPDWDYCSSCIPNASTTHPRHRFFPIYEPCESNSLQYRCSGNGIKNHGIFCDGPLCKNISSYISGDRYKCAICDDVDFCASCEASPENTHNTTHPLIKFKTPVRNVTVVTQGDIQNRQHTPIMGNMRAQAISNIDKNIPVQKINVATQVQTVFDSKPSENLKLVGNEFEIDETKIKRIDSKSNIASILLANETLAADFIRDVIKDGTIMLPNVIFAQTWYLRNSNHTTWPKGCYLKFIGGAQMCVDNYIHPENLDNHDYIKKITELDSEVNHGETISFTLSMKSPSYAGNFTSHWRLATPDHKIFGPKLWCKIIVKTPKLLNATISETQQSNNTGMTSPKLENENTLKNNCFLSNPRSIVDEDDFDDITDENIEDEESVELILTDDEYEILDASDEEYTTSQGNGK